MNAPGLFGRLQMFWSLSAVEPFCAGVLLLGITRHATALVLGLRSSSSDGGNHDEQCGAPVAKLTDVASGSGVAVGDVIVVPCIGKAIAET